MPYNTNEDKLKYAKQYYDVNKESIKEKHRIYREKNKEAIKERRKETEGVKFDCIFCGGKYTHKHKANHEKTQKHIKGKEQYNKREYYRKLYEPLKKNNNF